MLKKELEKLVSTLEANNAKQGEKIRSLTEELGETADALHEYMHIVIDREEEVDTFEAELVECLSIIPSFNATISVTPEYALLNDGEQTLDFVVEATSEKGIYSAFGGPMNLASAEQIAFDLLAAVITARDLNVDEAVHYLISAVSSEVVSMTFAAVDEYGLDPNVGTSLVVVDVEDKPDLFGLVDFMRSLDPDIDLSSLDGSAIDLREPSFLDGDGTDEGIVIPTKVDHRDTIVPAVELVAVP